MLTPFNQSNDIITTKIDGANAQFAISTTAQAAASAFWVFECGATETGYLRKPDYSSASASNISISAAFRHLANYFFGTNTYILDSNDRSTQRTSVRVVQIGRPLLDEGIWPNSITAILSDSSSSLTTYDVQNVASLNSPIGLTGSMVNASNTAETVGTIFYDHGVIIFHGGLGTFVGPWVTSASVFAIGATGGSVTSTALSSGSIFLTSFVGQSRNIVKRTIYFTRAFNRDYNFTTNPTARNSTGFIISSLTANPTTFITTIGLYDDSGNLLAVGKINPAKRKDQFAEALFKVQLDY